MSLRILDTLFATLPQLRYEPTRKRVRVVLGGETIVDTTDAVLVWEPRRPVPSSFAGGAEVPGNGLTDTTPVAASFDRRLCRFAKGLDGRIYHASAPSGQPFGGWFELPGGGQTDAAPAAAAFGDRLYVFTKGLGGGIFVNSAAKGQPFGALQELPGAGATDAAPAAAVFGSRLFVIVKGATGGIFANAANLV